MKTSVKALPFMTALILMVPSELHAEADSSDTDAASQIVDAATNRPHGENSRLYP